MSANHKDVPEKLRRVLELGSFKKLNQLELPDHFGNELVTYGSDLMKLRLAKDRGQWAVSLGPSDLSGQWHDLEDVLSAVGSKQERLPTDLDSLAGILFHNFPKIQKLFEHYSSHRDALKRAAESGSGALMREIFPSFQGRKRAEYRVPPSPDLVRKITQRNADLIEAVQRQMGRRTSMADAEKAVSAVIHAIKAGVKKDKVVQLVGFGTFKVVERKARKGVNPKTLQQIKIPKSKTVKFVPSKNLKEGSG